MSGPRGWALVTGASSGIGRELARLAGAEGYNLVLSGRDVTALADLAREIETASGVSARPCPADLSQPGAAAALWTRACEAADGPIHVLVNNAGLGRHGAFASDAGGDAREDEVIAVNVSAATELMRLAIRTMRKRGAGRILNVASAAGYMPGPGMAVYHASKAYLLHLSEAVSEELSDTSITVTALCPGVTRTGFFERAEMGTTWLMRIAPVPDAARVARAGWRACMAGRRVAVTGIDNKIFTFLARIFPRRLVVKITGLMLRRTG
ncbi:SDR family NAD(P)-dependent oxidoreductase [Thioclava atlantica]|uniref:Short-chain dehydrogenase n=1 Tax=Thioclava atlantica TaxID=1317124 RepID=A0A085U021_9RHOB|nr:SDR family oxidoreductase [Thioclava atlantica]KFE36318.1 short-chain dehydrogenase [Thioclava atlantica]